MSALSGVEKAARAHTMLNMFAAIQALLESGCMGYDTSSHTVMAKISKLCVSEQQRYLRVYDAATKEATR